MDDPELTSSQWIARCAARLGARWRTAATADLEAAAVEVWRDPTLRDMTPEDAATAWLAPVSCASGKDAQNRPLS